MISLDSDEGRFASIAARCTEAARQSTVVRDVYRLCGETVRISIAGERLAAAILAPFAHQRVPTADRVELDVDLWDARACGVRGLARSESLARGRVWDLADGRFAVSDDGRFVSHELRDSIVWFDRRRGRMVGWYGDGTALRLHQRGKPLQMLWALRASDRGLQAVHACCVARGRGGLLLPAASGSGKSTVAVACLQAGFSCLGDDWVALSREAEGSFTGHGLFASLYLDKEHARRFPRLAAHVVPAGVDEEKALVLAERIFSDQFAATTRIRAVVAPRFVGTRDTIVRPASPSEVLLSLVPSSVFTLRPRLGPEGVDRLAALAAEVPGYVLETGTDIEQIPLRLDEILHTCC